MEDILAISPICIKLKLHSRMRAPPEAHMYFFEEGSVTNIFSSIVGNVLEAVLQKEEFEKLKEILSLRCLKVSWGVVSPSLKEKLEPLKFSFPPYLEKLDLQGIPMERVPQWLNPRQLKNLKKLYIRGGELVSLDHTETDEWMVETLRLKYLEKLDIDLPRLKKLFPHLQRWEKIKCHEIEEGR